ncbi:MAG: S9 family peptidase [Phycisphaerales bacterium]|nr:S9 family peptidase [Phycisphaerales bacterium]
MDIRRIVVLSTLIGQSVCAPASAQPGSPGLIPRRALFGNPQRAEVTLSPDGRRLAYLAPVDGVMNIWVATLDDVAGAAPVTSEAGRGVRTYVWAFNSEQILFLKDKEGDENWHVWVCDVSRRESRDVTPIAVDATTLVAARIQELSAYFPDEVLIGVNDRDPRLHDIYRVNLRDGSSRRVWENDGAAAAITDDQLNLRLTIGLGQDGSEQYAKIVDGVSEPFFAVPHEDALMTIPVGFDSTGKRLYMVDTRGRNTAALVALDMDTGETKPIFADARADVDKWLIHPTQKTVQAVSVNDERRRWVCLDPTVEKDFARLRSVNQGDPIVTSRSLDDRLWTIAFVSDTFGVTYYLYDRRSGELTALFSARPDLQAYTLAPMRPASIKARDGLRLVSYLTLPVGSDTDDDGKPESSLPTVLLVHGGPWARDYWGYDPQHQWLANRGYAVLSVNFRGSTGFGKDFVNAGDREWAGRMQDDLLDAVQWAIDDGIADRNRVAIMGGSYGGYATLVGLTSTPDVFACGVDIVGPSSLVTLLESAPPYWQPVIDVFVRRVGDHRTKTGRAELLARSPLSHADQIRKPLLIAHGANDPRVKQAESDQIVDAMRSRAIPVTYVLYPDEGHGFARPENRLSFFAIAEAFLAEHLGGRVEAIGDAFGGSSLRVLAGADQTPGLSDSLRAHETP